MAINRVSANTVAAMLYPVMKPSRVPKVGAGRSNSTSTTTSQSAVQATSRPQSTDTSSTTAEIHASFEYALAALGGVGTTASTVAQSSPEQAQSGVVQQTGAYAQVEHQAGQALDITA